MSTVIARNIKYHSITLRDTDTQEVKNLISSENRITKYELTQNNKVLVSIDYAAKKIKFETLNKLSSFFISFHTLKEIEQDFNRIMEEGRILRENTRNLISKAKTLVEKDIIFYQNEIKDGEEQIRFHKDQTMTIRETENMANNILIALYDNDHWIIEMHKIKEYERQRGIMMREFDKKIQASQTNLEFLYDLKSILEEDFFEVIKSGLDEMMGKIADKSYFIKSILEKGNLLKNEVEYPNSCEKEIGALINNFIEYSRVSNDLKTLNANLRYNINGIDLNNKKWLIEVPLAGERAASEPLKKLLDYMVKKEVTANELFEDLKNRDRAHHLTECMKTLNANMHALEKDYNSIDRKGGISVTGGGTGVRNNLRIKKSNTQRTFCNFEVVNFNPDVESARAMQMEWKKRKEEIQNELRRYDDYMKLLAEAEQKIRVNEAEKTSDPQNHKENLLRIQAGYTKLKAFSLKAGNQFKVQSIPALIGMLVKNINLKLNRMSCSSRKNYEEYELDANQLYQIIFKKLKKNQKLSYGFCKGLCTCGGSGFGKYSKFQTLHNCSNIELADINEIILSTRILGCLKNSSGQKQEFINGLRGEDVLDSKFQCCKGAAEVMILTEMHDYALNTNFVNKRLKHYEHELIEVLENHKYRKLQHRVKSLRNY